MFWLTFLDESYEMWECLNSASSYFFVRMTLYLSV